ncbi:MAG: SDR family NAD(P)-dependent oxidoreductase [Candidatus Cryptobacteroides sp.]|nr:SDR family NAD(P)-dependent oxidoreductase [Bacteroidales bacterium]
MFNIKGKNVLITGGASGIGKIMGRICLEKGAGKLIVWDINEVNMASAKGELEKTVRPDGAASEGRVLVYKVNVSDNENIASAYSAVKNDAGDIDLLINCAGIVKGNNTFDQQTEKDIRLTMDINATAPMLVALSILPDMIKRDNGHICNIASAAGMLGVPKLSVYVASKWAVVGWTESMRIELKQMRSKVRVTTVAPYFINTGMFDGVNSKVFPILKPERTAAKIIRAIEKEKDFRGIPFPYHFIRIWQGILPNALFDIIFGKWFGVYSVMDHFTGRK